MDVGCGLTVIVYVTGVPVQPVSVGVTVIVEVIGLAVAFVAVNDGTEVLPLVARPMAPFELVQPIVAPAGVLVNVCAATVAPAHTLILAGAVITGKGFTITVVVAVQLTAPLVTVTVYVPAIAAVAPVRVGF